MVGNPSMLIESGGGYVWSKAKDLETARLTLRTLKGT